MTEQAGFAASGEVMDAPPLEELPVRRPRPKSNKYKVKTYNPDAEVDRTIFSHVDLAVAKKYVTTNHPRGREVYVEHPSGYREHYSADHEYQGSEPWFEFTEDED